tara:strand:+ start:7759 stop:9168 length:1410 start_codon:yes stop_codon:yes gene_type:complete
MIRFCFLLIGLCLNPIIADETELKAADFLFKAEVTGINMDWGTEQGEPLIYANRAFTGLRVNVLEFSAVDQELIDTDFEYYLDNNSQGIELFFENRISPKEKYYETLKQYKGAFGLGIKGTLMVSGKFKIRKIRKTVPMGLTGSRQKTIYVATIDQSPYNSNNQEFRVEGSWSVVSEKTVQVPFSGELLQAFRGIRTNGHKMYSVPNYQSCYHSILINLNEWSITGDSSFDRWLTLKSKNLKTDIKNVWRYTELYDQFEIYRNVKDSRFRGNVNVAGILTMRQYTLQNGSSFINVRASVETIEAPENVVQTKVEVVRLRANLNSIYKNARSSSEKFPGDIKVTFNATSYETPEDVLISDKFTKFIEEQVFEKNHECRLESYSTAINSILAHRTGFFTSGVRGTIEVIIDLESITNTLSDGSKITEYRYGLKAVKGPLRNHRKDLFEQSKTQKQAQRTINFHTLYQTESL